MVSKVTYKLNLKDLTDKKIDDDTKEEVGNYLVEQILKDVSKQLSPVSGDRWQGLSEKYKKIKAKTSGSSKANLELFGDMLDSLEFKKTRSGIEIGIFDYEQAQKADNHNKFSNASLKTPLPKRQFIPNGEEEETFRASIMKEVKGILDGD